ncbi:hypothetical protein D3C74_481480 [compost metagenome]
MLLPERLSVLRRGLDDDHRFPGDLGQQHEHLVPHLVHVPVRAEGVFDLCTGKLFHSVPGVLLQRVVVHVSSKIEVAT